MSAANRLKKIEQHIQALPAPTAQDAPAVNDQPVQLAREMAAALDAELAKYCSKVPLPSALCDAESLNTKPIEDISFFDLERLAKKDAAAATDKWHEMADTATGDIATGFHAARTLECMGRSAWQRATFKSLRKLLRDAWSPRNQVESMLIDQITQYELLRQRWLSVFSARSVDPRTLTSLGSAREDDGHIRRLSAAQATKESLYMVERLQRLMDRAIRMLAALRGKKQAVFVRQVGQMNLAQGPQANVQNNDRTTACPIQGSVVS